MPSLAFSHEGLAVHGGGEERRYPAGEGGS